MPWYQTPDVTGYWGYHWTMRHFDPDKIDGNGFREIASQYYPITGTYDSQDENILEYQALLMKISGIDGVLVDWYGIEDFWDYKVLHESTQVLFEMMKKAGLKFAIVYEDQTVKHMVNNDHLSEGEAIGHGQSVMQYMQSNWFKEDTYLKLNNRPVLLTFGPQYFYSNTDWTLLFFGISPKPLFFTLDNTIGSNSVGAYPWPPMWKSKNGVLSEADLNNYLTAFHQKANGWDYLITSAFPAFHDIYKEAGVGDGYGFLDPKDGAILRSTLDQAVAQNPDVIQLVTWNDYGEGTIIEPTVEFGYQYLEIVQEARILIDPDFPFKKFDLSLPFFLYQRRLNDPGMNDKLDQAFQLILQGQTEAARQLIGAPSAVRKDRSSKQDFALTQNYPNPFNPSTKIEYRLPQESHVLIDVYDVSGQQIRRLLDEIKSAGSYEIEWDGQDNFKSRVSSGVYMYRLLAKTTLGHYFENRKMILIR